MEDLKMEKSDHQDNFCALCLANIECEGDKLDNFCDDIHDLVCRPCLQSYITHKISNSVFGTCPIMYCPCLHADKMHRIMKYKVWAQVSPTEIVEKYSTLAQKVLGFMCGNCHSFKSLHVDGDHSQALAVIKTNLAQNPNDSERKLEAFTLAIANYSRGLRELNEFYDELATTHFPTPLLTGDSSIH